MTFLCKYGITSRRNAGSENKRPGTRQSQFISANVLNQFIKKVKLQTISKSFCTIQVHIVNNHCWGSNSSDTLNGIVVVKHD